MATNEQLRISTKDVPTDPIGTLHYIVGWAGRTAELLADKDRFEAAQWQHIADVAREALKHAD